jgi:hypothetical protein
MNPQLKAKIYQKGHHKIPKGFKFQDHAWVIEIMKTEAKLN